MSLLGPDHPETGYLLLGVTATIKKLIKSLKQNPTSKTLPQGEEGGRIPARAFPEFFLGWPGSGSVVNHYYCMQISMQIPQGSRTLGKC